MVTHMKTTIDIADALLLEAKRLAAERGTTLRAVVEEGLDRVVEAHRRQPRFSLRDASFGGRGLQEGVREGDWQAIRTLVYEGRGG